MGFMDEWGHYEQNTFFPPAMTFSPAKEVRGPNFIQATVLRTAPGNA